MKGKIGLIILFIGLLWPISIAVPAAAHVLKVNNGIYAVMHIDPDDNPAAGQLTIILLEFGANQGSFHLADCNCQVALSENGRTITTMTPTPAFAGASYQAIARLTFPKIDVYQLVVTGQSKDHQFQNFSLSYVIRVAITANQQNGQNTAENDGIAVLIVSLVSLLVLGTIAYLQISQSPRYKQK